MIEDAAEGQSIWLSPRKFPALPETRFDFIQYTRQLLSYGVGVFFQNDNINTFDEDAELRLSIMSSIAQDELRKLSSRVKFGHQQAIKSERRAWKQPHLRLHKKRTESWSLMKRKRRWCGNCLNSTRPA